MSSYQIQIRAQSFRIRKQLFQGGWGLATLGDAELSVWGKAMPGAFATVMAGALAGVTAGFNTVLIPYRDIQDIAIRKNLVTIKFKIEGKDDQIRFAPFKQKGFFWGKGPLGSDFVAKLQEKRSSVA